MEKLKLLIKIAAVGFTAPATIEVTSGLYPDNLLYRLMAMIGGLILVEGALLLGWHGLDHDTEAPALQRGVYAALALVAYGVLWVIAWAHGEGAAGIAIRLTLLVVLAYSIARSGILKYLQETREADRSILRDWSVRFHARKLDRAEAKAEREAMNAVRVAFLSAEQQGGLHAAGLYAKRLEAQNNATHELPAVVTHELTHELPRKWDRWVDPRTQAKDDAKAQTAAILKTEPDIATYELARRIGKSETTVRKYRRELEAPVSNGNGRH